MSDTIIFLHIGKTAGSTLRPVLKRQFPRSEAITIRARRRPREETLTDFAQLPEADRMRPRLIMGHTVFGLHESVPRPSTLHHDGAEPCAAGRLAVPLRAANAGPPPP